MKIAVYENDTYYLQRICEVMSEKYEPDKKYIPLQREEIQSALKDSSYSMYILPEDAWENADEAGKPVIFFCEKKSLAEEKPNKYLFKYQTAAEMKQHMENAFRLQMMYYVDSDRPMQGRIITYLSLGSGMGSSAVAMGTAAHFANQNENVLYLNLKPFSSSGYFEAAGQGISLEALVEDIRKKQGGFHTLLEKIARDRTGVFVLKNYDDFDRLNQLTAEEFEHFLKILDKTERFHRIIMDIQMTAADYLQAILKNSAVICVVLDGSSDAMMRFTKMTEYLKKSGSGLENKIKIIYNKYRTMPDVGKEIQDKVAGGIGYIESGNPQDVLNKAVNMKFLDNLLK